MAHEVLQRLGVHTALCHVGTKCVPANVRGDFGHLHLIDAVVLLADVLEVMLPMKRHHRLAVLIQIQKAAPSANHRLGFGPWPAGDNALEALYTSSVIGISRVPLAVFVSSMMYSMFRFR